jgi:hypothetical protein
VKKFVLLFFLIFWQPLLFSQNITITVADSCGFVVKGKVKLTAIAQSNGTVTISQVQFDVGGVNIGSPLTTAPYSLQWDSTTVPNGCHTINATATDSNSNTGAASVNVSVKN